MVTSPVVLAYKETSTIPLTFGRGQEVSNQHDLFAYLDEVHSSFSETLQRNSEICFDVVNELDRSMFRNKRDEYRFSTVTIYPGRKDAPFGIEEVYIMASRTDEALKFTILPGSSVNAYNIRPFAKVSLSLAA